MHPHYGDGWRAVLQGSSRDVAAVLVDEGEHATALRQVSPFAGALAPRERWSIWRQERERAPGTVPIAVIEPDVRVVGSRMRDATDSRLPERRKTMTLDQWAARDEDDGGELVDGALVEEEVPSYLHEWVVTWLVVTLGAWILPRGGGIVPSEIKLAVRPDRGRKADLVVHLPGVRLPGRHSALLREPPSILIEVISPQPRDARRDRVEKLDEYATFRVPWYWIVDPGLRTLEVYELGTDGRYVRALGASEGVVVIPGCDGLTLNLEDLWAHVDRLRDE